MDVLAELHDLQALLRSYQAGRGRSRGAAREGRQGARRAISSCTRSTSSRSFRSSSSTSASTSCTRWADAPRRWSSPARGLPPSSYKLAFDRYIKDHGYTGIRSLVAFSGTVEDPDNPGSSYTEVVDERRHRRERAAGDVRARRLPGALVAEKYQTGFDQPLLQTMYVVKRLAGVQAVQTLSRLNRIAPGKARHLRSRLRQRGGRHLRGVQALLRDHPHRARTPIRIVSRSCSTSCSSGPSSRRTTSTPSARSGTGRSATIQAPTTS